jgi:thiol-disulfide isomerase/thioredoxin
VTAEAEGAQPQSSRVWIGRVFVLVVLAILAANLLLIARAPRRHDPSPPPSEMQTAPAFSGRLVSGQRASLADQKGKVVLLDFWATWCAPCAAEMPVMAGLQRQLAGAGKPFSVVGINAEGEDTDSARVAAFLARAKADYPNFVDDGTILGRYHVDALPHLVLIDREGRVRRIYDGLVEEGELKAEIEPLLR